MDTEAIVRAIRMAAGLKARVVMEDERESGRRQILNLGHTVGHAIEASLGYRGIRHGEAVSLGMIAALRLSSRLGYARVEHVQRMERLLKSFELPVNVDEYLTGPTLSFMGSDKKRRSSRLNFVVPSAPGQVEITSLDLEDVKKLVRSQ